jgi:hypothetical protein
MVSALRGRTLSHKAAISSRSVSGTRLNTEDFINGRGLLELGLLTFTIGWSGWSGCLLGAGFARQVLIAGNVNDVEGWAGAVNRAKLVECALSSQKEPLKTKQSALFILRMIAHWLEGSS